VLAWPEELKEIKPALRRAHSAGIDVSVLCFGPDDNSVGRSYQHEVADPEEVSTSLGCRLFVLVADREQVIIGGFLNDGAWAIMTDDPANVVLASEFVHFDMSIQFLIKRLSGSEVLEA
jgi:hypothetical protein